MDPIVSNPNILGGTPCFAGTRVPVESLFDSIQRGYTLDEFLEEFPTVPRELAITVLNLAKDHISDAPKRAAG